MSDTQFRAGKKRFFDNKKFSRGFAKSGDFTIAEEDLLTRYGSTMQALESGELQPENEEEEAFLRVVNQTGEASTKLERVWLKYVTLSRGRKKFHTLNGGTKPLEVADDYVEDELPLEEEEV